MSKRSEYLTKRDLHREYIKSPVWREFRRRAFAHYGAICNRCGDHGTDVDHLHYNNWGEEKLEDVQILCRGCHEAKHAIERSAPRKKSVKQRRSLHLKGIWAYITNAQKRKTIESHQLNGEAELRLNILCATKMTPILKDIASIMNIHVQFPRSKKGWKGPKLKPYEYRKKKKAFRQT